MQASRASLRTLPLGQQWYSVPQAASWQCRSHPVGCRCEVQCSPLGQVGRVSPPPGAGSVQRRLVLSQVLFAPQLQVELLQVPDARKQ